MTTTITIKDKPVNTTYQNVTGSTSGSGSGATFDVTKTNGVYSVIIDSADSSVGTGYVAGDTIVIPGTSLGGTNANNLTVTVGTVGTLGKVATFSAAGTGRIGDGVVDVQFDITGTAGIDTYVVGGASTEYTVTKHTNDVTLASTLVSNLEIKLADHERVVFTDKAIAYDAAGKAGDVYSLLAAALGVSDVTRAFEGIGIALEDAGWTSKQLATAILNTDVYKNDAGGVSDETFLKHVFKNVVGTDATLSDVTTLTTWMNANHYSQADVLVTVSKLPAFATTIGLVGLATSGIEYTPITF